MSQNEKSSFLKSDLLECVRCLRFYPAHSFLLLSLLTFGAAAEMAGMSMIIPVFDFIQYGGITGTQCSFYSQMVAERLLQFHLQPTLPLILTLTMIFATMQFGILYVQTTLGAKLFFRIRQKIRNQAYDTLIDASPEFHTYQKSGAFVEVIHNQVTQLGEAIRNFILIVTYFIISAAYLVFLAAISWKLTLLLCGVAILKWMTSTIFTWRAHHLAKKILSFSKEHTARLIETLHAIILIKAFSREPYEKKRYREVHGQLEGTKIKLTYNEAAHSFLDHLIIPMTLCVIVWLSLTVFKLEGTLVLIYITALVRVFNLMTLLNQGRVKMSASLPGVHAVVWLRQMAGKPHVVNGTLVKERLEQQIELKQVGFSYGVNGLPVLDDLNLSIRRDEHIAIVGPTGSGKTTLVHLLLRLYDPTNGAIFIDGIDLRQIALESWHNLIGYVSQDTFIFNASIYENIRYGKLTAARDEIEEAIRLSHASEFINKMPDGVETMVGDRGARLSGGQRQRIAIARAFLRNPQILLMDEATSALDSVTESFIEESTRELAKNRTTITIAHRLTTIQSANRIIVLDQGKVVEEGTHESLIARESLYKRYHELQILNQT
ncbi:MAG: hypothetical protein COV74_09640 [Candidatus Omnitrophica bacterium CG11_big_fil_rev_8_21_14_0_20_45_26]|uniref:ABC transporter ATP-binding protein n=1 Tax=Candidatus Abzuiibacterium crystallinum TaxID=1974748 RepID=A0A2H0LLE9_9BACT|nr:MAG: hypothetical protein COV74_09640 [Candidatus Omnitrophica bacterium CG11_big_fil_rev_8_21_14_0_20_45_26]PIW65407.1 MAG: hypothetical protein COW12_02210 [Candidatus Omnitrophica bacterium CG12_big_fil_rev_8_21_14_0_65_45_16]